MPKSKCNAMVAPVYPCYCACCKVYGKSRQPTKCWRCDALLSIDAKEDGRRVCPDSAACWHRVDARIKRRSM